MPHTHGYVGNFDELVSKIIEWSTDTDIHGADAWELIRNEPWPCGTILKGHGFEEGEHFYAGLMPLAIQKGKTYLDWFWQPNIIGTYFVWNKSGLNSPGTFFQVATGYVTIKAADGSSLDTYSFQNPDIFSASAQALYFGMFKQYIPGLDWNEQPGGMNFDNAALRPVYYSRVGDTAMSAFTPPVMPGVGYPAIGMDYSGPLGGILEYWLVKDRHRLILITKNQEFWDMAYLGFIEPYQVKTEYPFPVTVIGGTSGAIAEGVDFTFPGSGRPTVLLGLRFDYRPSTWALTHGIPTFAAAATDEVNALSQVRLMLPDGRWQSFANWSQGTEVINNTTSAGTISSHSFANGQPVRTTSLGHYLRPACSSLSDTHHVVGTDINKLIYQLEPLEFVEDTGQAHNLFGRAWRVYWPSFPIARYGEIMVDGKLHLLLPNVWEGRRWHIPHGRTNTTDPAALLQQANEIEKLSGQMNCLVRLED